MKNIDQLGNLDHVKLNESENALLFPPHLPIKYDLSSLQSDNDIAVLIQRLRNMLVKYNQWLDLSDHDDQDKYDRPPYAKSTSFLVVSGDKEIHEMLADKPIAAAVRMTEVDRLSDSLSLEMWENAIDLVDKDSVRKILRDTFDADDPSVLDLTRFLTLSTIDSYPKEIQGRIAVASISGMLELFGGGIGYLNKEGKIDPSTNKDVIILFTTGSAIRDLMVKLGINITTLHEGTIGKQDPGTSALCAVAVVRDILTSPNQVAEDPFLDQFSGNLKAAYNKVVGESSDDR